MLKIKIPEPTIKTLKNSNLNEEQKRLINKQLIKKALNMRLRLNLIPKHTATTTLKQALDSQQNLKSLKHLQSLHQRLPLHDNRI